MTNPTPKPGYPDPHAEERDARHRTEMAAVTDEGIWTRFAMIFAGREDATPETAIEWADRMLAAVRERLPSKGKPGFGKE